MIMKKKLTNKFGNDLKVATLIRCFLPVSRQHLELNLGGSTTHKAVGEAFTTYEQITSNWTTTKVLKFCRQGWPYGGGPSRSPTVVEKPRKRKGAERKRQAKSKRTVLVPWCQGNGTGNKGRKNKKNRKRC